MTDDTVALISSAELELGRIVSSLISLEQAVPKTVANCNAASKSLGVPSRTWMNRLLNRWPVGSARMISSKKRGQVLEDVRWREFQSNYVLGAVDAFDKGVRSLVKGAGLRNELLDGITRLRGFLRAVHDLVIVIEHHSTDVRKYEFVREELGELDRMMPELKKAVNALHASFERVKSLKRQPVAA